MRAIALLHYIFLSFLIQKSMRYSIRLLAIAASTLVLTTTQIVYPYAESSAIAQTVADRKAEGDRLYQQGIQQYRNSQFREALESWQAALQIYRDIGDRQGEGKALIKMGNAYSDLKQYQRAIELYEQGQIIARQIGDRQIESIALINMGSVYYSLEQYQRAIELYEQGLIIARQIGDRQRVGIALENMGNAYYSLEQYQRAIELYEQGLIIARQIGDKQGEENALGGLGNAYFSLREYQRAIEFYEQKLVIVQQIADRQEEGNTLGDLGNAYFSLKQYQQAIELYEQQLVIAQQTADRQEEGNVLMNMGNAYYSLEQYQQAIELYEQSLAILRQTGNRRMEGIVLNNLGNAYNYLGHHQQAIELYEQQLRIALQMEDREGEGSALLNLSDTYRSLGQYHRSIELSKQALVIKQQIGDREGEGIALGNLGNVYIFLGQYQQAIELYEQRLRLAQQIGDRRAQGFALGSLGITYNELGQPQRAIGILEQALVIMQQIGNRNGEGTALGGLGSAYMNLGQYQRAIELYEQKLRLAQQIGNRRGEGVALGNLGVIYSDLRQYQRAIELYEQVSTIMRQIGDREGEGTALSNLGLAFLRTNQLATAEEYLFKALSVLQSLRTPNLSSTDRITLFETQTKSYQWLQESLIAQSKSDKTLKALEVAEQSRARTLIELLAERFTVQEAAAPVQSNPDLRTIRAIAQQQNATLVQYSVINTQQNSSLYIWVINPEGKIQFKSVDLRNLDRPLKDLVQQSRDAMDVRGRSATIVVSQPPEALARKESEQRQNLQTLYKLLIEPIAQHLPTNENDHVIFIPQGELFLVPFAALMDASGKYLIEKHTILTSPSIQVLDLTRQQRLRLQQTARNRDSVLVVGNPTMPATWNPETGRKERLQPLGGAEQEAIEIARKFNTQPLLEGQATEAAVRQRMQNARIIHLATHGLLEYGDPRESGVRDFPGAIALAPNGQDDGLLTSSEIYGMNLNAELVVLSACDTGRGTITGDGVLGLSRAFMQAGVPSVVVSLWKVPDEPTAELMKQFYENLQRSPDKAQALRRAMLTTMKQHSEPRNWAAFTLIGEAD